MGRLGRFGWVGWLRFLVRRRRGIRVQQVLEIAGRFLLVGTGKPRFVGFGGRAFGSGFYGQWRR